MLRKSFLSVILLIVIVWYPFAAYPIFSVQPMYTIPLGIANWSGTGQILSKPAKHHHNEPVLSWQPQKPSAYLKSTAIPKDWESYNQVTVTLSSNKATQSWINILICDNKNVVAHTFVEIDFQGEKTFIFSLKNQFPSFSRTNTLDWKHIAFFAFESHSIAHLDIEDLVLTIERIELRASQAEEPQPFPPLSSDLTKSVFFPSAFYSSLENCHEDIIASTLKTVSLYAKNAVTTTLSSPENLFYVCLSTKLNKQPIDESFMNRSAKLFQKQYWDSLLQQNDILIQEHGLFFMLTYDLIREDLLTRPSLMNQFRRILEYLADMEYHQCVYWINTYPYGHGNNHVTRAASFLAMLAYYYSGSARNNYYQYSQQVLSYFFSFQIDEEGVLNEGSHYYLYLMETLSYFGYFEWNLHHRNFLKDFSYSPKLEAMVRWAEAIRMPNGFLPAIDDAWQTKVIFPICLINPLLENKSRANFISMTDDVSNVSGHYPWNVSKPLYIPLLLFTAGETFETEPPTNPPSYIFFEEDQAVLKKDWSVSSSYVFFSGKQNTSLHEHNDTGQIQIFANRIPILVDSGYGPEGWSSKHRQYYVSGTAHNVVLIDSKGPIAYYNGSIGPADRSSIKETLLNISLQSVTMMINRDILFRDTNWERTVVYIPETGTSPYYCIVYDQLNSTTEHQYRCVFHPNGTLSEIKDNSVRFQKNIPQTNQTAHILIHSLTHQKAEIQKGLYSAYWGEEMDTTYLCYSNTAKQAFFATLLHSTTNPAMEAVVPIPNPKQNQYPFETAFRLQKEGHSFLDILYRNPDKKVIQGNWLSFNGSMAYLRNDEKTKQMDSFITLRSSFLNFQNVPLFYAQKNIDYLYFSANNTLYDYYMEYESFALTNRIYLNLFDISSVLLDNKEVTFESFSGGIHFSLPPGKHHVILIKKGEV